ncbi:16S rRNA (adenine(1518)-N(6)/adenine(1519)-N(6))-dimethyltransferase RsmA [Nitrosomonadales bacterium]|nr:16S rRNA (adenine(1518)-N(6)/adenine(1519)-N(6))-dimethyltransferase RsmA [Nitrosomonadales bacterium]
MKAKKKFGQNFLTDRYFISKIINEINPKEDDHILEIGPGKGAITEPILKKINHISVVEIDPDMIKILKHKVNTKNISILAEDVLDIDNEFFVKFNKIIGNLPYYIATEIILKLTKIYSSSFELYFMVQKEVAERITAKPSNKTFGRLSVILQYYFDTELLFEIPPEAFSPQPKITSAFIRLVRKKRVNPKVINKDSFEKIVKVAFSQKRKTIKNNFKNILFDKDFFNLEISPKIRSEALTIDQFIKLENYVAQNNINFDC